MPTPSYNAESEQADSRIRLSDFGRENDKSVTMVSTARDAGNSPTTILRKGLVVGRLSTGKFIQASDGSVVASTAPTIQCATAGTYNFTGGKALTLEVNGHTETVNMVSHSACTNSGAVSQINAGTNLVSAAAYTTSLVQIHVKEAGANQFLKCGGSAAALMSFAAAAVYGTDGEYGIMTDGVDLKAHDATSASDRFAIIGRTGLWDESTLHSMTADAKMCLLKQGAIFR